MLPKQRTPCPYRTNWAHGWLLVGRNGHILLSPAQTPAEKDLSPFCVPITSPISRSTKDTGDIWIGQVNPSRIIALFLVMAAADDSRTSLAESRFLIILRNAARIASDSPAETSSGGGRSEPMAEAGRIDHGKASLARFRLLRQFSPQVIRGRPTAGWTMNRLQCAQNQSSRPSLCKAYGHPGAYRALPAQVQRA